MKTKQSSIKVLDVTLEDKQEFITFFDKNYIIFQNHLLNIEGTLDDEIRTYLKEKNLNYTENYTFKKAKDVKHLEVDAPRVVRKVQPVLEEIKEIVPQAQKTTLIVKDKLVRSGQELNIDGDLLLLNRVNSGGTINVEGHLVITEIVEGSIRCNGDFMMLKASPKANIVFHDVEVDNSYLTQRLNRVELINNEIKITPVLKETNWG